MMYVLAFLVPLRTNQAYLFSVSRLHRRVVLENYNKDNYNLMYLCKYPVLSVQVVGSEV